MEGSFADVVAEGRDVGLLRNVKVCARGPGGFGKAVLGLDYNTK